MVFNWKTSVLRSVCPLGSNTESLHATSDYYCNTYGIYFEVKFLNKCLLNIITYQWCGKERRCRRRWQYWCCMLVNMCMLMLMVMHLSAQVWWWPYIQCTIVRC